MDRKPQLAENEASETALLLYWVEVCGSESQFMILMFY